MADILVAGEIDLPRRGRSSGVERAAGVVATWTLLNPQAATKNIEVKRLSEKYRLHRPKLEAAAKQRFESGEAATGLEHVKGLGCAMPGRGAAYHDSVMARRLGNFWARELGEALRAIDPDVLRGARDCRELAGILERQAQALEAIAKVTRFMAGNLTG
jgi:hypothetical protein